MRIGEHGSTWTGVVPMLLGMAGELSYGWPVAVVVVVTIPLIVMGRTPGEAWSGFDAMRPDAGPRRLAVGCARTAPALALLVAWVVAHPLAAVFAASIVVSWLGVALVRASRRG